MDRWMYSDAWLTVYYTYFICLKHIIGVVQSWVQSKFESDYILFHHHTAHWTWKKERFPPLCAFASPFYRFSKRILWSRIFWEFPLLSDCQIRRCSTQSSKEQRYHVIESPLKPLYYYQQSTMIQKLLLLTSLLASSAVSMPPLRNCEIKPLNNARS